MKSTNFFNQFSFFFETYAYKNSEKWNTIPKTYAEIDTLRVKFEKQGNKENLTFLEDINVYVEDLEKKYSSV